MLAPINIQLIWMLIAYWDGHQIHWKLRTDYTKDHYGMISPRIRHIQQIDGVHRLHWTTHLSSSMHIHKIQQQYRNINKQFHWHKRIDCKTIPMNHASVYHQTMIVWRATLNQMIQKLIENVIVAMKSVVIKFTRKAHISKHTNERTQVWIFIHFLLFIIYPHC